jgi:hypothetical protein
MENRIYLKATILLFVGSIFLQNCGPDDYVQRNCDQYYVVNLAVDTLYFFEYEHTDTIRYKRIMDNVVQDTLMFTIQERRKDSLAIDRNEASTNDECISTVNYFEQWYYLYKDARTGLTYKVQLIGKEVSRDYGWGDQFLTTVNSRTFVGEFGSGAIGDKSTVSFSYKYSTSEGEFLNNYTWSPCYRQGRIKSDGWYSAEEQYRDYSAKSVYNPDYGRIQISFNNEQEIWDLIP